MEIDEQKSTYGGFVKIGAWSTVAIVGVMLFLAAFVA